MNIAAYCRVSTDTTDQLNSLEAQKTFFADYTQKNGHNLVKLYADEGLSGTKIKNRAQFLRLMRDAQHGLFDMVVVKDISRFARNTVDFLQSIRALKALGVETTFLTSNQTVLGNSEFVLTIFGALAQEESANISKRVKFGKKINAGRGRVPNIVYGYNKTNGEYFNMEINPQEADIIRQIYDWYTDEGYGAHKIALMLDARGAKTKRHCKWSQNAVSRILSNELYTGKIINGKQEIGDFLTGVRIEKDETEWMVTDRPDLQIITPQQFERAQKVLAGRVDAFNINGERQSNKHLFSSLIKCNNCGSSFRRTVRTYRNTYVKWVCCVRNANGANSCNNKTSVDEGALIDALKAYFAESLKNRKNIIKNIVAEFTRVYKAHDENAAYEQELQAKYDKLLAVKQKYMDMYVDELISREELNAKTSGMKAELDRLANELKLAQYNLSKGDQLERIIEQTFKEMEDIAAVEEMSNAQLKRIVSKIVVSEDGSLDIYLHLFGDIGLNNNVLIQYNHT